MVQKKSKDADNAWRTNIENAPLDEETWKVKVIMIEAAGSDQDRIYLNKFEAFAAEEKRFVIKNICKTETIFMVNQLGGEKKIKDESLRVFEEGQACLKEKKEIAPDMLALIIKHLIIKIKEEYLFIKKQRLEVKEGVRRESNTMIDNTEIRGAVNVKPPEPLEPLTPLPRAKKGQPEPAAIIPEPEEGKKYNTQLRVRGEEWRDKVYVDDYPTDGPNLYVAVTGFSDPLLPGSLLRIGIPLSAIVQLRIDPTTTKVPSSLLRSTKRGQSQTEILAEISMTFWEELQLLRITKPTADEYKNTAFVVFSPPYWDADTLTGNPSKIYDEVCYLIYDVQDLTRQHHHYLQNMDIINIPETIEDEHYEEHYHHLIDNLPLECVTYYSILDSILQTVCNSEELKKCSSRTSLSSAVTLNKPHKNDFKDGEKVEKAQRFVKEVFKTLCKTDANRKSYRLTYGEEYESHKSPLIITYGDFAKNPTFHLGNSNLDDVVRSSLYCMPLHNLWTSQTRAIGEQEAKINFHVNILLSCFERADVETAELNRLVHILACRKLYNNRSSLKRKHLSSGTLTEFKKNYLKRSALAEPLTKMCSLLRESSSRSPSFPSIIRSDNLSDTSYHANQETNRIKLLFDCPDISELISAAELANGAPINHMIDDFDYFEDFSGISAFQILLDAYNKFNCVDYRYCEVTDCFVLLFFNSHDKDGVARDEWRCHLPTPVCLQDFFDFVLEENYDWIQAEEKVYNETMVLKSQSEYKVIVDPNAIKSCIAEVDVELDLLIEGSLKYHEMAELEELDSPNETVGVSLKSLTSPTSTDMDTKIIKKVKSPSTIKNRKQSFMTTQSTSVSVTEIPPKPFLGYDLSDRRVEVFGKDATYFSRDGTRVISNYTLIIPPNEEYIAMRVIPGNNNNEFWFHRALGDNVPHEIIDFCESFRITSKDNVLINIRKQIYKVSLPVTSFINAELELQELFETYSYHSLFLTWPNGLITESVYEDNSPIISHIKQHHTSYFPGLNETMRCISLKGEVIIFREAGYIDILRPDGTVINIRKYCKKLVVPEVVAEVMSDTSSAVTKKGKNKEKFKEKSSKASSKSKEVNEDGEERKPPEYEFVVEEYEIIETSGLKQKWVKGVPFTIEKLLVRTATDYCLGEIFSRRMDGTHVLLNKDGVHIVTFPDKTRIITKFIVEVEEVYPEWTEDEIYLFDRTSCDDAESETGKSKISFSQKSYVISQASVVSSVSGKKVEIKDMVDEEEKGPKEVERTDGYISIQIMYTVEHANFTTVSINKASNKISVESPNNTEVVIDSNNNYELILDSVTTATFNGKNLHILYEACPECHASTTCDIKIKADEKSSVTKTQQNWMKMKDSFAKGIVVNEEGSISLSEEVYSDENIHPQDNGRMADAMEVANERQTDGKSESSIISHGKCRELYRAKTIRFFVLRR